MSVIGSCASIHKEGTILCSYHKIITAFFNQHKDCFDAQFKLKPKSLVIYKTSCCVTRSGMKKNDTKICVAEPKIKCQRMGIKESSRAQFA